MAKAIPPLRPDQVEDLAKYFANPFFMNLSEASTGKTPSACLYTYAVWTEWRFRSIWVQPKSIMDKNRDELLRFTDFTEEEVVIVDGTPSEVRVALSSDAKVFLMGPNRMKLCWEELFELHPDIKMVVVDEFHAAFANAESDTTKTLFQIRPRLERLLLMTGTLVKKKIESVYPAIHLVEPRYYATLKTFMAYHYSQIGDQKKPRNFERIAAILNRHSVRHTVAEIHGHQPCVETLEPFPMDKPHREIYDRFEAEGVIELEHALITGVVPGIAVLRCRQIMEHPDKMPLPTGGFHNLLPKGTVLHKDEAVRLYAKEETPLVVFAYFVSQQQRLAEILHRAGRKVAVINGNTTNTGRISKQFREGEFDTMVVSPQCASMGHNWQMCGKVEVPHIVIASSDYSDVTYLQLRQRFIRGPRQRPLHVSILEYKNSMDQRLREIHRNDSRLAQQIDATRETVGAAKDVTKDEKDLFD